MRCVCLGGRPVLNIHGLQAHYWFQDRQNWVCVGGEKFVMNFKVHVIDNQRQARHAEMWLACIMRGSMCVCFRASPLQLPHSLQTVCSHHGGRPSLCEGQKRRVPLVGDKGDLWGPVTAAAGKHALWGSVCDLTTILYRRGWQHIHLNTGRPTGCAISQKSHGSWEMIKGQQRLHFYLCIVWEVFNAKCCSWVTYSKILAQWFISWFYTWHLSNYKHE